MASASSDSPDPLPGDLGRGQFGRATVMLYRWAAITVAFAVASLPAVAASLLLPWEGLAVMAIVVAHISVAIALSAALAAWRDELHSVYPAPWRAFWKGWRTNAVDVLRAAAPGVLSVAVVAVTVGNAEAAGIPSAYLWLLIAIGSISLVTTVRVTVLAAMFSFRVRDLWRLASYTLVRVPRATVALLAIAISAVGLLWLTNEAVLLLMAGLAARLLLEHERAVIEHVRDKFTVQGRAAGPDPHP